MSSATREAILHASLNRSSSWGPLINLALSIALLTLTSSASGHASFSFLRLPYVRAESFTPILRTPERIFFRRSVLSSGALNVVTSASNFLALVSSSSLTIMSRPPSGQRMAVQPSNIPDSAPVA